jgi:multiple sugar transport system ATP-binding protein
MGSPAMNFVPCTLVASDRGLGVEITDGAGNPSWLPVPNAERLGGYVGKQVILGVRPEMITDPVPHKAGEAMVCEVPMQVLVTEPTGADTMLVAEVNGVEINCRINPGYSTPVGQIVPLMFDMGKVVFFDPTTEERIDRA